MRIWLIRWFVLEGLVSGCARVPGPPLDDPGRSQVNPMKGGSSSLSASAPGKVRSLLCPLSALCRCCYLCWNPQSEPSPEQRKLAQQSPALSVPSVPSSR